MPAPLCDTILAVDIDLSLSSILASLVFGIIGFVAFRKGKKDLNFRLTLTGVALMAYPIFISGPAITWLAGAGLTLLAYYVREPA